jgi:Rieske Fe-S protein
MRGTLTRRDFCKTTSLTLATLGLPACGPETARVGAGPVDDPAIPSSSGRVSAPSPNPQPTAAGSCSSTAINAGKAASIAVGAAQRFTDNHNYDFYVLRDEAGIYAVDATCSHAACSVKHQGSRFVCPCHGATFDLNGQSPTAPAVLPLDHLAVCIDGSGNVLVDYAMSVSASSRASTAPSDGGVADLSPLGPRNDLSPAAPNDLARPAPADMAAECAPPGADCTYHDDSKCCSRYCIYKTNTCM